MENTKKRGRKAYTVTINEELQTMVMLLPNKYQKPIMALVTLVQNEKDVEVLRILTEPQDTTNKTPLQVIEKTITKSAKDRIKELTNEPKEIKVLHQLIKDINEKYNKTFKVIE